MRLLLSTTPVLAAATGPDVHVLSVVPFVLLLLAVALLPILAPHFWHSNRNQLLIALAAAVPVAVYLVVLDGFNVFSGEHRLAHGLEDYIAFIALLFALYTVAGGIVIDGDLRGTPLRNTLLLALGAGLANLIGTTGASMLLIRPFLRMNAGRRRRTHLVVFFIFVVSNMGGLLTPLGDPPLFLGFLEGVRFTWTFRLWPAFLLANGLVLAVFFVWESWALRREGPALLTADKPAPFGVRGKVNFLFLAGVLATVLLESPDLREKFRVPDGGLAQPKVVLVAAGLMFLFGLASLFGAPAGPRSDNRFTWGPLREVAAIFLGLFVAMVPALEVLHRNAREFDMTEPWQFFWATGLLSSALDNAPTYLAFATIASGDGTIAELAVGDSARLLEAISCGAVLMGANSYIGNGPNFMVKAIADDAQVPTPSFFGYMAYSGLILLPIFVVITFVLF
jgi:Na+/H+ antiporter NhaD/arsenite permease-like protein